MSSYASLLVRIFRVTSQSYKFQLPVFKPQARSFTTTSPQPRMTSLINTAKSTIAENFGSDLSHTLVPEDEQFSLEEVPDLTGKVAVVTGGSEGIGYGVTSTMLSKNIAHIHIISLNQEVVDGALDSIRSRIGPEAAKKVSWYHCDMGDLRRVSEVAAEISQKTDRIDMIFNNAARGIMTYQLTDYGVDRHMAVNHFGPVVLTSHLLPILKKTAEKGHTVRIVNQASNAHQSTPSDCKFASLTELNTDIGPNPQYGRSKLAAILYARYLNKHLTSQYPNILANATHPGFVKTKMSEKDIHEPYPLGGYAMSIGMAPFKKDQFQGAVSSLFALTKTTKGGEYICPPAVPEPGSDLAQNMELGEQLMKLTIEIIKDKTFSQSVEMGCSFKTY